ncbi:MAG: hypothetical protein RL238_3124 [Actinomycetota bacterium]|jgi:uncharacterized protein (TIGR03083 family)
MAALCHDAQMITDLIREERLALVERLERVTADEWTTPSLCDGWTVHMVLAHLTTPFLVPRGEMMRTVTRRASIAKAFDQHTRAIAAGRAPDELVEVLRANAGTLFHPPGMPYAAPFTDTAAHHADITWALGDEHHYWADPARLKVALDFLTTPRARLGFVRAGATKGVTLVADDTTWRHGSGAEATGPALSLVMALIGRRPAFADLRGSGVSVLQR